VRTVEHLDPEAKRAVARFKWDSHGLVITREGQVLYTASDHRANAYDALVAAKRAVGEPLDDCR
jgi:hypothetical protein